MKIIIEICGGCLDRVTTSESGNEVYLFDHDSAEGGDAEHMQDFESLKVMVNGGPDAFENRKQELIARAKELCGENDTHNPVD